MKELLLYSIDLTTKNELNGGFSCLHKNVTEPQIRLAFKKLLNNLRKKAKAKKRNWKYAVYAVTSEWDLKTKRKVPWHVHALIYGSPSRMIVEEMKSYWTRHYYGLPKWQKITSCYNGGKLDYTNKQKTKELLQKYNLEPQDFGLDADKNITKKIILSTMEKYKSKRIKPKIKSRL